MAKKTSTATQTAPAAAPGNGKGGPKGDSKSLEARKPQLPAAPQKSSGKIGGKGFENLQREDILLPRLLLLQALSPQVVEGGEKPGTMYVNLSNVSKGTKVIITPVLHYRSRIKWIPKDDGGGIDCQAQDAKNPTSTKYAPNCAVCPHKEWDNEQAKPKDQQPKCTMYDNFVVLIGDSTEPVILSMGKTQTKVSKKFYSAMALKGGDMFDYQYELTTVQEANDRGDKYFNFAVKDLTKKTQDERRKLCDTLWASLSKASLRAAEPEQEEAAAAAPAGGPKQY